MRYRYTVCACAATTILYPVLDGYLYALRADKSCRRCGGTGYECEAFELVKQPASLNRSAQVLGARAKW